MTEVETILNFIEYSEGLKREKRFDWLTNGDQESVAEHCWRIALMAVLIAPKLSHKVDLEKVLKMIAVHDISEIEAGDTPLIDAFYDAELKNKKHQDEMKAIYHISSMLRGFDEDEIKNFWLESGEIKTPEARFVKWLDKIEARIQKYQQPTNKWTDREKRPEFVVKNTKLLESLCDGDPFLLELTEKVRAEREKVTGIKG